MFNRVSSGKPRSSTSRTTRAAYLAPTAKRNVRCPSWETATDGTPRIVPSIAADTVPEYITSSPKFTPLLIPDTKMDGGFGKILSTARFTQSTGVPFTEYVRGATRWRRKGLCRVTAWATAVRSRSGATTQTSPIAESAWVSEAIPAD